MSGNQRLVVARASQGRYTPSCFRHEACAVGEPGPGQVLVETHLMSLDPTHLNWVKLDPALQFLPIGLGDPMLGTNIGTVIKSCDDAFCPGDVVMGTWGWEQKAVASAALIKPALAESEMAFDEQLSIMSHVGHAAAGGIIAIGKARPGDTVLVSAAAGATGSLAAQVAKALGCFVVGIAGGAEKCAYLIDELGLDGTIDYRRDDIGAAIRQHFPRGIDVYFDNVGGEILDAVLLNMAQGCRIAVCGAIAQYDRTDESGFGGVRNLPMLVFRQARMEGFLAGRFGDGQDAANADTLRHLYQSGKLKTRIQSVEFRQIPEALAWLTEGRNTGKLIARFA